jgi:hypothetical protein
MNKKEIAEIKKQFKFNNDKMVINNIASYYIKEGNVIWSSIKKFASGEHLEESVKNSTYMGALDSTEYLNIFKKTLSGQIGKGVSEFAFPNEELTKTDGVHSKLMAIVKSELNNKKEVDEYVDFLMKSYDSEGEYMITIQHSSYSVPQKNKNDEIDEDMDEGEVFNFIIVAFCPVDYSKLGLYYDAVNDMIIHNENEIKIVGAPSDGFMFPTFNDRSCDVNNVLVFNKTPKEPNKNIIETILGCEFVMSPEDERERFNTLVTKIATADNTADIAVDYEITQSIHSQIVDLIEKNSIESEVPTISAFELKNILRRSGIKEDKLKNFEELYEEEIGGEDIELKAVNVINSSKMDIKSPDVVINVKATKTDKVTAQLIEGKRCLVVELDDNVEINGLDVKIN